MANLMKPGPLFALFACVALIAGCGGGSGSGGGNTTVPTEQAAAAPTISTTAALNGAEMVSMASTTSGATIYYTIDGTTPTTASIIYESPFMVASNLTINAIATASGDTNSTVTTKAFTPNIASGTLVWSDEFTNSGTSNAQPSSATWTYDAGASGWGNGELETYCAYGSTAAPCDTSNPNAFIAPGGGLQIVARAPSSGGHTSARMKTEGLFSFQYGRIEVKAKVPEAQGFWPAFWLLGNNIETVNWPACGEMDVLERVNAATSPDWNAGSIHGSGFTGTLLGSKYYFSDGETAADWHTYGMIWSKGSISYYIDDPTKPYSTYTPSSISGYSGSVWPFDSGPQFILMNLAVGGNWPGSPDSTTPFPSTMQVQYVRIYSD